MPILCAVLQSACSVFCYSGSSCWVSFAAICCCFGSSCWFSSVFALLVSASACGLCFWSLFFSTSSNPGGSWWWLHASLLWSSWLMVLPIVEAGLLLLDVSCFWVLLSAVFGSLLSMLFLQVFGLLLPDC